MNTGKRPPGMREDGGNQALRKKTNVMFDGFQVRNRFRGRLVTKLKKRVYHGRNAGGQACLGRGGGM